ncbi:squalene monooxygenase-like [Watersipora subatra]|uniref:squalene monooxygenase-like n=1 Tax=Watersipora subatra TaxID=2589382 RepID=UPI00355C553E
MVLEAAYGAVRNGVSGVINIVQSQLEGGVGWAGSGGNGSGFTIRYLFYLALTVCTFLLFIGFLQWRITRYIRKKTELQKRPSRVFSKEEKQRVIVIGSGVLGSSLATVLAQDGRQVTLIERDMKEPDRIIGELLQPGGCDVLRKLGLGDCLLECEGAQATQGYVIHDWRTGTSVHIPFPKDAGASKEGIAFRHGKFIMALRSAAARESNVTVVEATAQTLIEDNGVVIGVSYKRKQLQTSEELYAPLVVVADGGFSKFRKQLHDDQVHLSSHFVGCIMKDCPQIKDRHAELVLSDPNPILVYKISEEETRILVDIRSSSLPRDIKDYLLENTLPYLPEHLAGPFEDGVLNGRVRSMPCRFLPPSTLRKNGVLMLGDAFNMRHPLTGGGMSVALNDIYLWRGLLQQIPDLSDYQQMDAAHALFQNRRKKTHSFVVNILAQALYELFSASDENLSRLRDACFKYFKLGGRCVDGPVGLLSVLSPDPFTLVGHFFAVALYSVWLIMKSTGYRVHVGLYQAAGTFVKACQVIFPLIWSEIRTLA